MLPKEIEAAVRAENWRVLMKRLVVYAHRRLGRLNFELAEDAAREVVVQLFDPAYASWDPSKLSVTRQLTSVINAFVVRQKVHRAPTRPLPALGTLSSVQSGGDFRARHLEEEQTRAYALLLDHLKGDSLALKIVDLIGSGTERPEAQAAAAGVPVAEIRKARRRVGLMIHIVMREMEAS
jgi:hypothetical protein